MTSGSKALGGRVSGCLLALGIGFFTVVTVNAGFALVTGSDLNLLEKQSVFTFQILLVAAPFALLALFSVRARLPWVVGVILTAAFWGTYFVASVASRSGDANIGLGLLMLISPFIVAASAFLAARDTRC